MAYVPSIYFPTSYEVFFVYGHAFINRILNKPGAAVSSGVVDKLGVVLCFTCSIAMGVRGRLGSNRGQLPMHLSIASSGTEFRILSRMQERTYAERENCLLS